MNVSDFDFELPEELVAQAPPAERGQSRLLVLRRDTGGVEHVSFEHLPRFLQAGDLLVLNDTRVFPARLLGHRAPSGGAVECLLTRQLSTPNIPTPNQGSEEWEALMHPGQKLKPGSRVLFERGGPSIHGEVLARHYHGRRTIRLWTEDGSAVRDAIERIGHVPLPPYIKRPDDQADRDRYQTVYARQPGSVAAPTAGLHFTSGLLDALSAHGVEQTRITLHVGYGTFKPVRATQVEEHEVDAERYTVGPEAADALTRALSGRRRIIAVGTTTTRALESLDVRDGKVSPAEGDTTLFIHPGHTFRVISGLVTNFHLPRSSLLMLVSAFAGRDQVLAVYEEAVRNRYRFYSYGDAMLIL